MQKKRKSYRSVSEIGPSPPLKVDADAADDGRVGIWKAPLPGGTAELKIHKKIKQHSINIKNNTAHPHDMVHVPAKFWHTSMRFWVRKLNVMDRQTDGQTDGRTDRRTDGRGRCNISRPWPSAQREIIRTVKLQMHIDHKITYLMIYWVLLYLLKWY